MRRGVVGVHQTMRRILPAVAMCVVLVAAGVTYGAWAVSRRSTPLSAEPVPVAIVAAPMPKRARTNAVLHHDLNRYVLNVINTYAGGRYPYLLNTDYANYNGVTEDISYQGMVLLRAHPSGNRASHCVGMTFEVFFKAMQQRNQKAGDFIDVSRENLTGHTAVLIKWVWKDGKIIGLRYWSSQGSTNGVSYNTEYFNVPDANGVPYGNVMIDQVYIARMGPIAKYGR